MVARYSFADRHFTWVVPHAAPPVGHIGKGRFRDFADTLLEALHEADGFLPFTDRSEPEIIAERFEVSKKTFKRAVGTLYKRQLITLSDNGIRLARR